MKDCGKFVPIFLTYKPLKQRNVPLWQFIIQIFFFSVSSTRITLSTLKDKFTQK